MLKKLLFFYLHLLIELVSFDISLPLLSPLPSPVRRCSQDLSMCVNGQESDHVFGKNACRLFTRYICHSTFGPLVSYFVSLETGIWVERKKSPLFKKKYISKKQAELNELRANCALKIITFRYFAFFLEPTFYFL